MLAGHPAQHVRSVHLDGEEHDDVCEERHAQPLEDASDDLERPEREGDRDADPGECRL